MESLVSQEENLKFKSGWDIDAREAIRNAVKLKQQLIDDVLSDIANFCGKSVDIKHIQTTPLSKIFDELKRAEQYDDQEQPKYKTAATRLRDLLISSIIGLLDNALRFLGHQETKTNTFKERYENSSLIVIQANDSQNLRRYSNLSSASSTKRVDNIANLKDCEDLVSSIEMFAPHLPADLIEIYQPHLYELKSKIELAKRDRMLQIEEAMSSSDDSCRHLMKDFYQSMEKGDQYYMKEIGDRLNLLLKNVAKKVSDYLKLDKLCLAVTTLIPQFSQWVLYMEELNKWNEKVVNHFYPAVLYKKKSQVDTTSPRSTLTALLRQIKKVVDRTLHTILDRKNVPLADMENHFDGLVILLSEDAADILALLCTRDKYIRKGLNAHIISMGDLFTDKSLKVSKLLTSIEHILKDPSDPSSLLDDIKTQLKEASEQITIARKSVPLFKKVYALLQSPILSTNALQKLQAMDLSSVSYEALNDMMNRIIENLQLFAKSILHGNTLLMTPNASDRNAFYRKMQFALTLLIHWDRYQATAMSCVNTHANEENAKAKIFAEIELFGVAADRLVESTDYTQLGILHDNLRSISENFISMDIKDRANSRIETIDKLFFEKIDDMKRRGWLSEDCWSTDPFKKNSYQEIAKELISMKLATTQMAIHKKRIDTEFIDALLSTYEKRPLGGAGSSFFLGLSTYLSNVLTSDAPIAAQILSDHNAFYGHKLLLRNEKVLRLTVADILKNITGDDEGGNLSETLSDRAKARLLAISEVFVEEYWALVGAGLTSGKDLEIELAALVAKAKGVAGQTNLPHDEKVLKLMALIFAYWTLNGSKHYQDTIASQGNTLSAEEQAISVKKSRSLLQPHAGQIVGILRMLGLDEEIKSETSDGTTRDGKLDLIDF